MLSIDTVVNKQLVSELRERGYSRVPVYYGNDQSFIIGILLTKSLLGIDTLFPKTLK